MELVTLDHTRFGDIQEVADKYHHPMMSVLRAAAEGMQVVDIYKTFAAAGFRNGLPRLAFSHGLHAEYRRANQSHQFSPWSTFERISIPTSVAMPRWIDRHKASKEFSWETICPPVPKDILAKRQKRRPLEQSGDIFCWEVERWEPVPQLEDPVLLRPLHKQFYAVVGQWDLTPLEKELFALAL